MNGMWRTFSTFLRNTVDRGAKSLPRSVYKKSCSMAAVVMVVTTYSNDIRTRDNLLVKCMILDSTCISDLFNNCLIVIPYTGFLRWSSLV